MNARVRSVLAARAPQVLAWLEAAREPDAVEAVPGPAPSVRVRGLQLASAWDPAAEAALQAGLVPREATRAACYGIGSGALPRALLARPALGELRVVLFDPGATRVALARFDHEGWLADPRVELVRARDLDEIETPFAASPADLRLADPPSARLRDLVFLELATPHLARKAAEREEDLARRLEETRPLVAADGDAAELDGRWRGRTAWVAGAGPTLARHLARLAGRPADEPLVAVDAALAPLRDAGARVDAVVTIDPVGEHQLPFFAGDLAPVADAALVYSPVVAPDVLRRWPGRRLAFWGEHPRFAPHARALPRAVLWSAGSVLHPAVDLAVRGGAARVVLVGADFAHVGGRTHAAGSHWARDHAGADARFGATVETGRGTLAPTVPSLVGYLRDLERYVARHPEVAFVAVDRDGARIAGVPFEDEEPAP